MRPRLAIAVLAVLVVAGCTGTQAPSTTTGPPALAAGWRLDCGMGEHERPRGPWLQDCEVRASHTEGQKQEVWLAINPRDARNVVIGAKDLNPAASASCVWNGLFVTHDGGASWKDVVIGGPYAERAPTSPYYGYACNTDPMGVFTADGTLHWVVELYNFAGKDGNGPLGKDPTSGRGILQPGWKLVLASSHDGGDTFPDTTVLEYGDGVGALNDYSRIAANPKTGSAITVINTYFPAVGANTALIPALPVPVPAGGEACSVLPFRPAAQQAPQPAPIQPTVVTGSANPGNLNCLGVAANAAGTVALAAVGSPLRGGAFGAWFARSTDDAATFTDFTQGFAYTPIPSPFAESSYRTGTNLEMAYDTSDGPHKGTLYVVTAEQLAGDEADIVLRASTDDGQTWGAPVRVNQDPAGTHQFMPNLAVGRDGSLHAFWMDKASDAAHNHTFIDVTHGLSLDGGATWKTERVTTVSWDGELGKHQEGFPFIGDY
ncbi:MAG: hypothetical protein QOI63_1847, partial [Thermoplasmata archaeon]|nr:hypothetical protein [Thermoplasmata archaeon]